MLSDNVKPPFKDKRITNAEKFCRRVLELVNQEKYCDVELKMEAGDIKIWYVKYKEKP